MIPHALMRLPVAGHPGLYLGLLNATAAAQLRQKPWVMAVCSCSLQL